MNKKSLSTIIAFCLLMSPIAWAEATTKLVTFGIYSNRHLNPKLSFDENVALYVWEDTGKLGELNDDSNLSGQYMRFAYSNKSKSWFGIGYAVLPDGNLVDMSKYASGYLCVSLKSSGYIPTNLMIGIKSGNTRSGESWIKNLSEYGFTNDGKWHNLRIPIADFQNANTAFFDLSRISQYFMLVGKNLTNNGVIDFDEIYWEIP